MEKNEIAEDGTESSGIVYGNVGIGETTYEMSKFQGRQGHGFAAERAEHVNDLYHGKEAQILGDDNAKDGADRLVNGVEIQSKYCRNGSACIQECFENGKYRYYSKNGDPMQVEVPSDMYDDAIKAMRRRIEHDQVDGITNPNDAEKLVKKGHYTYEQVKRIAQAGTIESLYFDAANGIIIGANAMGITAMITFATSVWNGEDIEMALANAALSGIKVGGVSFITTVVVSQLSRTSVSTSVRVGTDYLVSQLGPKATSYIANSLRNGTNIYGAAAMNNVSKLLAGNIIASTVSMVILSAGDIVDIFRGRISKEQLVKDVATTGATIVGGNLGWGAGNVIGGVIGGAVAGVLTAGVGTTTGATIGSKIGGFAGSVAGGTVAGQVTHNALDQVIEDDAVKMMKIVEREFVSVCELYLLTENEIYTCLPLLKEKLTKKELKNIFASSCRELYAQSIILQCVNPILYARQFVKRPNENDLLLGVRILIDDSISGTGVFDTSETVSSLAEIQQNLLDHSNIKEAQIGQIMQPVIQMNRTQQKAERVLGAMKRSNEDMYCQKEKLMEERKLYKEELEQLLKD